MNRNPTSERGFFNPRISLAVTLCSVGAALAISSFTVTHEPKLAQPSSPERPRYMPVPGGEADDLDRMEIEWHNRLTYPTGKFNPAWIRAAALQDLNIVRSIPAGIPATNLNSANAPLVLNPSSFTALGPKPLRMTGCFLCFDYTTTEGRVNDIAVDPTTTTNGSIVAYLGSVGGGVWKTTNCCSSNTTWTVTTDDPVLATITIDSVTIDPNNHNTIYAGTGDLNFGSFSMGSQGVLKSTDAGATWKLLGANVFGPGLPLPAGQFPQYNAVGKVRVDPRNSNNVVAGTKTGLYFSYDGGNNWTGPCTTNSFSTMRQDITGLALTDTGTNTRIIAAVGVRGFATTVQPNLNQNGANGVYKGTIPASGCPSDFAPITNNATTGWAGLNAASGVIYGGAGVGNQLGRIDIAVAPSNPNYIYAQVQSITPNGNGGCGGAPGCQLGVWNTTNGGTSWTQLTGSAGDSLLDCGGSAGDYPQNWYDQGIAVDPTDPDRVFIDTFEVWFATRTGTSFTDTTCGYSYPGSSGPVHVDQHALAFVPGSSSILLAGNDGGVHATTTAGAAPTWFNMDTGLNTIEFYSGDISANFATSATPRANGGAQDNGSMSVTFTGSPTGPVQWQLGVGGDGFFARIDPVGNRFWQGNNGGRLNFCDMSVGDCTNSATATWGIDPSPWSNPGSPDIQSFILPYEIFKGTPGNSATDCPPAACGHLVVGTYRVWETFTSGGSWVPVSGNLTKQTLGNRSFINQLAFAPATQTVVMVGTNDGNVQIGFAPAENAPTATWVNVTGSNMVLPNRPILDVAIDPTTTSVPIGYAAIGGFNANTPTTPGHVYRIACSGVNCASFTWTNKTGNLPDIPVDSIIANPRFPQQVFAGTDWGLYYTNDITAVSPQWARFQNGLPHSMIWDMQIDRGSTTLSVWTRSRGAYVWPLPSAALPAPVPTAIVSRKTHGPGHTFDVDLKAPAPGIECRSGGATGDHTVVITFASPVTVSGNGSAKAQVSSGTGQIGANGTADPNAVTVNGSVVTVSLTNVANAQRLSITIFGVSDGTNSGNVTVPFNALRGDTNANGVVNSSDVSQTKINSGQTVSSSNFRTDVTVNDTINSSDVSAVKAASGTALPP